MASHRSRRTLSVALLLTTTCGAIFLTAVLETRRHQLAYAMPVTVVVVAGLCVVLIAVGGVLAMRAGQVAPWLAPVAAMGLVLGFLEAPTLIVVPLVVLLVLVSLRRQSGRRSAPRRLSVSAAVLLILGLVPLSLLALDRPVVECLPDGVSAGTPIWTWFGGGPVSGTTTAVQSGGGSSSSSAPQRSTGAITTGGVTYTYTCDGGKLVQFTSG